MATLGPRFTVPANVGDVLNTNEPDPVSSEMTPANSDDVVAANALNLFAVVAIVLPFMVPEVAAIDANVAAPAEVIDAVVVVELELIIKPPVCNMS